MIKQNGTGVATTREDIGEDEKQRDECDIQKEGDNLKSFNDKEIMNHIKYDGKGEDAKKFVKFDEKTKSNAEFSESADNEKGMFQFCSKHVFLLVYIVLGLVIMVLTVLNLVFGFKPVLLISLIVMVFLLLVLLTD